MKYLMICPLALLVAGCTNAPLAPDVNQAAMQAWAQAHTAFICIVPVPWVGQRGTLVQRGTPVEAGWQEVGISVCNPSE